MMTLSDHHLEPRIASQPLLQDYTTSIPHFKDALNKEVIDVSLRALEDGSDSGSEFEALRLQRRPGFWRRLRMSIRRRHRNVTVQNRRFESARFHGEEEKKKTQKIRRRRRYCLAVPVLIVIVFGLLHILNYTLGYIPLLSSDSLAPSSLDWSFYNQASSDNLLDITHNVNPIPCHSHNDYWRRVPLYDALRWGCTGVEADVWLFNDELFVGHNTNALTQNRTFRAMYVDPLVEMLEHRNKIAALSTVKNGMFDTAPKQTLVLLVDFKNDGHKIFPVVSSHLAALREKGYLTYFNGETTVEGAITVVATGNAPFDVITANTTYRDIFFDAPLDRMYEAHTTSNTTSTAITARGGQGTVGTTPSSNFDSTNSYYASVNFRRSIGWTWFGLSTHQLDLIRGQIRGAHQRGLKARYWSAPKWPIGLRNYIWNILIEEGVDYLNGDDLQGMTKLDWGVRG